MSFNGGSSRKKEGPDLRSGPCLGTRGGGNLYQELSKSRKERLRKQAFLFSLQKKSLSNRDKYCGRKKSILSAVLFSF